MWLQTGQSFFWNGNAKWFLLKKTQNTAFQICYILDYFQFLKLEINILKTVNKIKILFCFQNNFQIWKYYATVSNISWFAS